MTRLTLAALIVLMPNLAAAWGKTSYYSYSSNRTASYTTASNNKGASDQQGTDKSGSDSVSK